MKVYQYLFFLYKNTIMVIEYDSQRTEKFFYIKNQGEKMFPVTANFWDWWKSAVCYLSSELTDFCFIYDKEYDIIFDDFVKNTEKPKKSCWTENTVKTFLSTMLEYTHIVLIDCKENKIKIDKSNVEFCDNTPKTFYTNMEYNGNKSNSDITTDEEDNKVSVLARYFRALLASEQQ